MSKVDTERVWLLTRALAICLAGQADELVIPNVLMRQRLDEAMRLRINDYSDVMPINVRRLVFIFLPKRGFNLITCRDQAFVGTWNINGGKTMRTSDVGLVASC